MGHSRLRVIIAGVFAAALWMAPGAAHAQCSGQFSAGGVCGNPGASLGPPTAGSLSPLLDRNFGTTVGDLLSRGSLGWQQVTPSQNLDTFGSAQGDVLYRGASGWVALTPGTNGQVLTSGGAAANLTWTTVSGTGTVTSVGLSAPASLFTVGSSPVTTAGTIALGLATQSANCVVAGPVSGSAAAPTCRSLVGADLPVPTVSALGGVQANTAVSHEWINAISTSGIPQLSQPAFSDISGTMAGSQCPTPTVSTLGCVEALVAVTSQWVNAISTGGVPSTSQPSFSDLLGNLSATQLPNISNNTVLSNISGLTAPPAGNTMTAVLDATIGNTQGNILYRGASAWVVLAPGTMGQLLSTGGPAANPSWATVSGAGTVTSVATGTGLTGGPITVSGTIAFASVANNTVLSNISGGSLAPVANSLTSVLDTLGASEGDVLYRGSLAWTVLTPGTSGQFLQTQGAAATPQWATISSSVWGTSGSNIYNTNAGDVGIGTGGGPVLGNLDVENGADTATICLNGTCTANALIGPVISDFYVATTGSDSNPCTSASPCLTIQHTTLVALGANNGGPGIPTQIIHIRAGTFTECVNVAGAPLNSASTSWPFFIYSGAGAGSTIWAGCNNQFGTLIANAGADVGIENLSISAIGIGAQNALYAQLGGHIEVFSGVLFLRALGCHMFTEDAGSFIQIWDSYTVNANTSNGCHAAATTNSYIEWNPGGFTIQLNTPETYTGYFFNASYNGVIYNDNNPIAGTFTGNKGSVSVNGSVLTGVGGCASLPGSGTSSITQNGVCN